MGGKVRGTRARVRIEGFVDEFELDTAKRAPEITVPASRPAASAVRFVLTDAEVTVVTPTGRKV